MRLRPRLKRSVVATTTIIVAFAAGCTVFTDTSGLTGGAVPHNADAAPGLDASDAAADVVATNDAGGEDAAAASSLDFVDLFDRPNGAVANGWIENTPGSYSILEGRVLPKIGYWAQLFLHRPASEDVLDVEVSVEAKWDTVPIKDSDATILVRIQSATAAEPQGLYGYDFYVDDLGSLVIARIVASKEETLESEALPQPINAVDTYRFRLSVRGVDAVSLAGTLEKKNDQSWVHVMTIGVTDTAAKRIRTAGSVGLATDQAASFTYDRFTRTVLASN